MSDVALPEPAGAEDAVSRAVADGVGDVVVAADGARNEERA